MSDLTEAERYHEGFLAKLGYDLEWLPGNRSYHILDRATGERIGFGVCSDWRGETMEDRTFGSDSAGTES